MMRKSLIALTATLIITGAGAASAQYAPPAPGGPGGQDGYGRPGGPGPDGYGRPGGPGAPGGWNADSFWRGAPDSPRERIQFLQDRIDRGIADGSLDRREGARASRQLAGIRQWVRQMHYDNGRLTPQQRADVQARLDGLSRQIRWMRHNGW